jgi:hypothetical protein
MAQFWFQLAQHAEDREAIDGVDPAIDIPNAVRHRKPTPRSSDST